MKRINPCKLKGRYGENGKSGRRGRGGFLQRLGCCEGAKPFLSCAEREIKFFHYKMTIGRGTVQTFSAQHNHQQKKGETLIVPCNETFRTPTSQGTQRFRRALKKKTKFKGCEPLELELIDKRLVQHRQMES